MIHKPYAMMEEDSTEQLQALVQHAALARARLSVAVLPLLEVRQRVPLLGRSCDAISVQLEVANF